MTLDELDRVLVNVGSTLTDFNRWPCLSAYEDVLHTSTLSAEIESSMSASSLAELAAAPDAEQRRHSSSDAGLRRRAVLAASVSPTCHFTGVVNTEERGVVRCPR
jgi:hypothetical protein